MIHAANSVCIAIDAIKKEWYILKHQNKNILTHRTICTISLIVKVGNRLLIGLLEAEKEADF
jgi:hypothetical protein